MLSQNKYLLPNANVLEEIISKISEKFSVEKSKTSSQNLVYCDTFDWRLYTQGNVLIKDAKSYSLKTLDERKTFSSINWNKKKDIKFWWEFPNGALQDRLKSIIYVRALLPVVYLNRQLTNYKIISPSKQTVADITYEKLELTGDSQCKPVADLIVLHSIKNVLHEYLELQRLISTYPVERLDDLFLRSLRVAGKTAGDYVSKIEIKLDPELPSSQAAKKILGCLFEVMTKNEEGIKKNVDIEFLHDYRVAVRRTRSVLGQLKGIFAPAVASGLKKEFSQLGKLSNQTRDLDVYLLKKNEYQSILPGYLNTSLEPFFNYLKNKRKMENKKLLRKLNSTEYIDFKKSYQTFLNEDVLDLQNVDNSNVPIRIIAAQSILAKYNQVIDYGRNINKKTPDEDLHRLRIECKKLRYLLELFSSLYPPSKINFIITQLKNLQTNLGDFNDLFVQQETLRKYLKEINLQDKDSINSAAAIGGLITHLFSERQKVRKAFKKTFNSFNKSSNKKIHKLFSPS